MLLTALLLLATSCGGGGGGGGGSSPANQDLPDLSILDVTFSPTSIELGDQVAIEGEVINLGENLNQGFRCGFYLSEDEEIKPEDDFELGYKDCTVPLDKNETWSTGNLPFYVQGISEGTYHVGVFADIDCEITESSDENNSGKAIGLLTVTAPNNYIDLAETDVSFSPAIVEQGESIDVSDTVENLGNLVSGTFRIGIYLSDDPVFDQLDDSFLGYRTVGGLSAGGSSTGLGQFSIGLDVDPGTYYVGAFADYLGWVFEPEEGNNWMVASGTLIVEEATIEYPDLIVTWLDFDPIQIEQGDSITVDYTIKNQGNVAAAGSSAGIFLTIDKVLYPGNDHYLDERNIGTLAPNDSVTYSDSCTVNNTVPPGAYYVGVYADYKDQLVEEDEDNNDRVSTNKLTVDAPPPPMPNLTVSDISFQPLQVERGETIVVAYKISNTGTANAGYFEVGIYLSDDMIISPSDWPLKRYKVNNGLAAQSSMNESYICDVDPPPGSYPAGTYYVGVYVDDRFDVQESDETDNWDLSTDTLKLDDPAQLPDLIIKNVSFSPTSVYTGDTVTVSYTVENIGNSAAGKFKIGIYLNTITNMNPSWGYKIGTKEVNNGLAAGYQNSYSETYLVHSGIPEGDYWVGAFADSNYEVTESDEYNNDDYANQGQLKVEEPPTYDLEITSASFTPGTVNKGDNLSVTYTIKNNGNAKTSPFHLGIYLSDDTNIDPQNDHLHGYTTYSGLNGGATNTNTITEPVSVNPGTYYVAGFADPYDDISELDENNNIKIAPGILYVNAPPSYIELPAEKCATVGYDLPNHNGHPLLKGSSGSTDKYVGLGNDDKGATTGYDYGDMWTMLQWDVSTSNLASHGLPSGANVYKVELVWKKIMDSPGLQGEWCKVEPCTSNWSEFSVTYNTIPSTTNSVMANFYWPSQFTIEQDMTGIWNYWKGSSPHTNYGVLIYIPGAEQYECALLYSCHSTQVPFLRIHF